MLVSCQVAGKLLISEVTPSRVAGLLSHSTEICKDVEQLPGKSPVPIPEIRLARSLRWKASMRLLNLTAILISIVALLAPALVFGQSAEELELARKQLELEREQLKIERQQLELIRKEIELERARAEFGVLETEDAITMKLEADVLFEFGKSQVSEKGKDMLRRVALLIGNLETGKVVVEGHTDSKGTEQVNLELANDRARAVKAILVENEIDAERIENVGIGESQPIVHNTLPDGSDFPEGRARNRRVQIRVDKEPEPPAAAEAGGIDENYEIEETEDEVIVTIRGDALFDPETGETLPEASKQLAKVGVLLAENAETNVAVEAHTDKIAGRDDLARSKKQAEAAKALLVEFGIDEGRIKTGALGSSRPVDYNTEPNGDDFPEGRANNRRLQLRIREGEIVAATTRPPATNSALEAKANTRQAGPSGSSRRGKGPLGRIFNGLSNKNKKK